ncbi:MAG: tetratricopeptide repeat protein [Planctomycetes bacterium]|nr:tetratricopeptide repeat protein [Planctomycetota bacterium]
MTRSAATILALWVLAGATGADVVFLHNGKTYEGKVTQEGSIIVVDVAGTRVELRAADVREVVKAQAADAETPPAKKPKVPVAGSREPPAADRTFLPEGLTRPEAMAFMFMRRLKTTAPGVASFEMRKQVEWWRSIAHDRLRKVGAKWVSPRDFRLRRKSFEKLAAEADALASQAARIRPNDPAARSRSDALKIKLAKQLLRAAARPGDPLLRRFMTGVAHYYGGNFAKAETDFRMCRRTAPIVAAFAQGHALALQEVGRHEDALRAMAEALRLRSDSSDALEMLRQIMKRTPGAKITSEAFVEARKLSEQYADSSRGRFTSNRPKAIRWLLPGKVRQGRQGVLPLPSYDRMVFRQAPALAVGSHMLLVDASAVATAAEIYVRIADGVFARAKATRTSPILHGKQPPPLTRITVEDYEFTPAPFAEDAKFAPGEMVTIHSLGLYTSMGSHLDVIPTTIRRIADDGSVILSGGISAGDAASPVLSADGRTVGVFQGKTNVAEADGGPDRLISNRNLAPLMKRIRTGYRGLRRYGSRRRSVTVRKATGAVFVVLAIECETLD